MITFILTARQVCFYTNPKSGVTTTHHLLENVLREHYVRRDDGFESSVGCEKRRAAFIFRNPYERAVSMFFRFNRVLWTDPSGVRAVFTRETLRKCGKEDGFTFLDFLNFLQDTAEAERDIHYRSQGIPERYGFVILTHRYYSDLTDFFSQIGYDRGLEALSELSPESIIANSVKKNTMRDTVWGDVRSARTFDFERYEESGYPPYDLFLDPLARKMIEGIFGPEIHIWETVRSR